MALVDFASFFKAFALRKAFVTFSRFNFFFLCEILRDGTFATGGTMIAYMRGLCCLIWDDPFDVVVGEHALALHSSLETEIAVSTVEVACKIGELSIFFFIS